MSRLPVPLLSLLALAVTTTSLALPAHAAGQHLEVLFVAEGAGPVAYIEVTERGSAGRLERSAAWAFFAGGETVTRSLQDSVRGDRGAPLLADLPSPPVGLGVSSDADGTLLFTLDGLGDWQAGLVEGASLRAAPGGPAVSSDDSARLLIEPPTMGLPGAPSRPAPAVLYGTRGALAGHATVTRGPEPRPGDTLLLPAEDESAGLVALPLGPDDLASARTFVADRSSSCDRAVPSALLLWPAGRDPLRLVATAAPACLRSGRVIVPFAGARLAARADLPLRAVLVDEPGRGGSREAMARSGSPAQRSARYPPDHSR